MSKPAVILVFGEDGHDRSAIKILIEGLRPDFQSRVTVRTRREPLILSKSMDVLQARTKARKVVAATRAEAAIRRVISCVIHQDTDEVEPSSAAMAAMVSRTYAQCPGTVVPAVAAWEVEAWWYLFPDAVATVRQAWKSPSRYIGRDTGMIVRPKEALARDLQPPTPRGARPTAGYQEGDSVDIARAVVASGRLRAPQETSLSWTAFVSAVTALML